METPNENNKNPKSGQQVDLSRFVLKSTREGAKKQWQTLSRFRMETDESEKKITFTVDFAGEDLGKRVGRLIRLHEAPGWHAEITFDGTDSHVSEVKEQLSGFGFHEEGSALLAGNRVRMVWKA